MSEFTENETAFLKHLSDAKRQIEYYNLSKMANNPYGRTKDVRNTMKDTGLTFPGRNDYFDFDQTGGS